MTEATIRPEEAARLAKQASFGPTPELISSIVAQKSAENWLNQQFTLSISSYEDLAAKRAQTNICSNLSGADLSNCNRENFSATLVQMRFYSNALQNDDQLRQRVAFALSQILVTSEYDVHVMAGLAGYQQILLSGAFGNYRDIIKSATLNPYMGAYLNMVESDKSHPNENYARELMQLFSIGTVLLNPDGTPQIDDTGSTIPSYNNNDVREVSRSLTGWTWARLNGAPLNDNNNRDWSKPMVPNSAKFDGGSKFFLGRSVPASESQQANVDAVVDAVFNHPNTAPFVCRRLIQLLTVANPSAAYVGRVAAVFANNGTGVRGDMKAVVRAIYLDTEARVVSQSPGKVKEPVLLATSVARAVGLSSDGYAFLSKDVMMGQAAFRSPSVFNYYPHDFPLPQGGGLNSPVSKLMNTSTIVSRNNFIYDWTIGGDKRDEFEKQAGLPNSSGTTANWGSWEAYGTDDGKILDRINLVLLNGTMTNAQRQSLMNAMAAIKSSDPKSQTRKRAQMALYVVASSPLFQVDR